MKLMGLSNRRRAISPVISAVILSAAVIAIGGTVWFYSQGAMAVTAEDYVEGVVKMTDVISERFIIEMVWYDSVSVTVEEIGDGGETFNFDYFPVVAGSETIYLAITGEIVGPGGAPTTKINLDYDNVVLGFQTIYADLVELTEGEMEDYTIADDEITWVTDQTGKDITADYQCILDDTADYTLDDPTGVITLSVVAPGGAVITADYTYIINPLNVWIFNYGTVGIEVKVQVKGVTCPVAEDDWIEIPSNSMVHFPPINLDVISKEELNINAYTKRGNNAYYKYIVP